MNRPWQRPAVSAAVAALTAAVLAAGVTACGNSNSPSSVVSGAASAAASAASSVGAEATAAIASATSAAGNKLDEIKGGVNAKDDVTLAAPAAKDGYSTVDVTVRNTTDATKSFGVKVDYKDASGNLLDTTVVTVSDVPANGTKSATAKSNRKLTGEVKTDVSQALRY
ncbi:FxLYD domain-containing protein [Streptomyces sp. NPDC058953]|uniref:FxLYD domain-containing protein n=1 Tax=unclassified Streptomyces TaxID=2593676 RepID=UPI0036CAAB95